MGEFSIIMYDGDSCNMNCSYCCGHLAPGKAKVKIDQVALTRALLTNSFLRDIAKDDAFTINLWGGEPLLKIDVLEYLIGLCRGVFPGKRISFFISTNGVLLKTKKVQDFIERYHDCLVLQLSHDGLGQKFRSKYDPLLDKESAAYLANLAKRRILKLINVTLSGKSPSFFANMFFFNKWMADYSIDENNSSLDIKLNHINDSSYTEDFNLTGKALKQYIHELELCMMQCIAGSGDRRFWWPYIKYLSSQARRWEYYTHGVACSEFSAGIRSDNWVVNTLGECTPCQLWDRNEGLPNPMSEQPAYCKDCEYKVMAECHPCPTKTFAKECDYQRSMVQLLQRMHLFINLLDATRGCSCQK